MPVFLFADSSPQRWPRTQPAVPIRGRKLAWSQNVALHLLTAQIVMVAHQSLSVGPDTASGDSRRRSDTHLRRELFRFQVHRIIHHELFA